MYFKDSLSTVYSSCAHSRNGHISTVISVALLVTVHVSDYIARCLPVCAKLLLAFNSKNTLKFDVALLMTSISTQKPIFHVYICCLLTAEEPVLSTKASNASLLITGALPCPSSTLQLHSKQPSEGHLRLLLFNACFLFSCGAQHLFTFGTMSHERCRSSFQPSFFRKQKNENSCGFIIFA